VYWFLRSSRSFSVNPFFAWLLSFCKSPSAPPSEARLSWDLSLTIEAFLEKKEKKRRSFPQKRTEKEERKEEEEKAEKEKGGDNGLRTSTSGFTSNPMVGKAEENKL